MPSPKEIIEVSGRTVAISNPGKVYFPETGHTKLDVVRYYLSVADGALRGVAGRPSRSLRTGLTAENSPRRLLLSRNNSRVAPCAGPLAVAGDACYNG